MEKDFFDEIVVVKRSGQRVNFNDAKVAIAVKKGFDSVYEEYDEKLVNKVKENYEFEQTAEKTEVKDIPATRIRDMFKKYILPFILSFIIILVYMVVRYREKGILNVLLQTIAIPAFCEILLISLIAITRIPVGVYTPTLVLVVYLASITYTVIRVEKQADKN